MSSLFVEVDASLAERRHLGIRFPTWKRLHTFYPTDNLVNDQILSGTIRGGENKKKAAPFREIKTDQTFRDQMEQRHDQLIHY